MDARRLLLTELIDYAGLFPPASLDIEDAAAGYRAARSGSQGWILGRFVCPTSRLEDLLPHLDGDPWRISILLDLPGSPDGWYDALHDQLDRVRDFVEKSSGNAALELVEMAMPVGDEREDLADIMIGTLGEIMVWSSLEVRTFVEVPDGSLKAILRAGLGAKLRCGGPSADSFPAPARVASFISECVRLGLPFKATAGLHHAFRHVDPRTGFTRHGFVNLVAATALALAHGLDQQGVARIVADQEAGAFRLDGERLAWREVEAGVLDIERARRLFVAYGSCDFQEPINDLVALGVLPVEDVR